MKRAFIIHGWGESPESEWFPWLKKELETKGIEAAVFEMPDTENPVIEKWVGYLEKNIQNPDEEIILIGHSIGCQTILRYLEKLSENAKVGKVILVAPWLTLFNLEEEELPIAEPWEKTPIDEKKVLNHIKEKMVCIFSDNDPVVSPENRKIFQERFNAEITVIPGGGHFAEDDGATELPIVLEKI